VNHDSAALRFDSVQLMYGAVPLLLLLGTEALETFNPIQCAVSFLGRHAVEAVELVELALLRGGIELAESRLILKRAVLLGGGEILVIFNPFGQVAFALRNRARTNCGGAAGWRGHLWHTHLRTCLSSLDGPLPGSESMSVQGPGEQESYACAEDEPSLQRRTHNVCGCFKRRRRIQSIEKGKCPA
jgi:hypothetical protein